MNAKLAVALATLLSVASLEAQQRYLLPIGSNVNSRPAKVGISIGNRDTGWFIEDEFQYIPTMGDLETVVKSHLQKLADNFVPPQGSLNDSYSIGLGVDPGPYQTPRVFTLQQDGTIPPEMLEVKLDYSTFAAWKLQGIMDVKMRLFKGSEQIRYYSAREKVGPDSACEIGAAGSLLSMGQATVNDLYAYPWLKENWWDTGEITIEAFDGWATFYNANGSPRDGELIAVSEPPPAFLESLRTPEISAQSQAPVLVISTPRISRIARVGHRTEITVSAEASGNAHLEFAEALSGTWNAVPAYPVPLALKAGSSTFTHTVESPTAFYRLRTVKTEGQ